MKRFKPIFVGSTAVILFIAAAFVFLAVVLHPKALETMDPFIPLSSLMVFCLAGSGMLVVSAYLLLSQNTGGQLLLIAWSASVGLIYHLGTIFYGTPDLFVCFGNYLDWVAVPPRLNAWIAAVILFWMLSGSMMLLAVSFIHQQKHKELKPDQQPALSPVRQ